MTHEDAKSPAVTNPHDRLIKALLANTNQTREIIETFLPPQVLDLVDLAHLEQQPDTFIDARHRMHQTDILFKTRCKNTKEETYIWILIEQQTSPDVWLPLRIFSYIAVIWDTLRKKSKSRSKSVKIPFIYPLVISNASKAYPYSLNLRDMIEPKEARPLFDELFKNPIQLIDLPAISDQELRKQLQDRVHAQALLLTLKHIYKDDFQEYLETVLLHSLITLDAQGYRDEVANLLYYIYNEGNLDDSSHFFAFLHQKFSKDVEEEVMTLGQQAIHKAKLEALKQGRLEGKREGKLKQAEETAIFLLRENMETTKVAKATNLPIDVILSLVEKLKKSH